MCVHCDLGVRVGAKSFRLFVAQLSARWRGKMPSLSRPTWSRSTRRKTRYSWRVCIQTMSQHPCDIATSRAALKTSIPHGDPCRSLGCCGFSVPISLTYGSQLRTSTGIPSTGSVITCAMSSSSLPRTKSSFISPS